MKTSNDIPAGPLSEHELREQWNQQADEHNQWESLDSEEQLAWAQVRAIAMERKAALLAESDAGDETGRILRLAEIIRDVDGNHDKGAAALAESILSHPGIRSVGLDAKPVAANAPGPSLDDLARLCEKHEFHYEDDYSLQCLLNMVRDAILRWSGLAAPPADGEVAELVRLLNAEASEDLVSNHLLWTSATEVRRVAELLQQRHPAPVAVSERPWERQPGWLDPDGECWWCPPDGPAYWQMANPAMVYGGWILPASAMPSPAGEGQL
jgi:hypothetical protein